MTNVLFVILGVGLCIRLDSPFISSFFLFVAIGLAAYINRTHANILHLCFGVILFTLFERVVFFFVPTSGTPSVWVNNKILLIHLFFDFSLFVFLIYRGALSRWLYQKLNRPTKDLYLTNADISMFGVMILFMLVDLAAAVENLLRNLDYLGFSEEFAKPLWELNWIYYHYPQLKYALMGLQFLVLWSTISKMAKKKANYLTRFSG